MTRPSLYACLGVPPTFDEAHKFVTSPFIRSPFVLAAIRSLIALYTLATIIITLVNRSVKLHLGGSYLSLFTYLTLIGLCAYFFAAAVQTVSYALAWRRKGAGAGYALQRWPKILQALHVILHSTIVSFPILVTITFWAVLATPDVFESSFSSFAAISIHILNSAYALFEAFLTNTPPPPWLTLPCCVVFLAGYLGVAYITHATQGFYPYDFLDPHKQGSAKLAGWILGILVAEILIFCIIKGLMHLRQRWAEKHRRVLQIHHGIESGGESEDEYEWEEVVRPAMSGAGAEEVSVSAPGLNNKPSLSTEKSTEKSPVEA